MIIIIIIIDIDLNVINLIRKEEYEERNTKKNYSIFLYYYKSISIS